MCARICVFVKVYERVPFVNMNMNMNVNVCVFTNTLHDTNGNGDYDAIRTDILSACFYYMTYCMDRHAWVEVVSEEVQSFVVLVCPCLHICPFSLTVHWLQRQSTLLQ